MGNIQQQTSRFSKQAFFDAKNEGEKFSFSKKLNKLLIGPMCYGTKVLCDTVRSNPMRFHARSLGYNVLLTSWLAHYSFSLFQMLCVCLEKMLINNSLKIASFEMCIQTVTASGVSCPIVSKVYLTLGSI